MKEKKEQEIIPTEICCNCGNKISGRPYIKDGECYCHLCSGRAKLGVFDNAISVPRSYFGVGIYE